MRSNTPNRFPGEPMTAKVDEFIPTQKSLLSRLKNWSDEVSWKTFFDTYWKLIYGVARQAGLADAEAQDVVQETLIDVARKMPEFKYDPAIGSFKSWLKQLTRWRIQDQFRKKQYAVGGQRRQRETTLSTTLMEKQSDPSAFNLEQIWDAEWAKNLTEAALERIKKKVSPKHYQMFYLHVCKKLPALQVARRLDVKFTEVYYAKYTVSRLLQKELKHLEAKVL